MSKSHSPSSRIDRSIIKPLSDALPVDGFDKNTSVLDWIRKRNHISWSQYINLVDYEEYAIAGETNKRGEESDALYPFDW